MTGRRGANTVLLAGWLMAGCRPPAPAPQAARRPPVAAPAPAAPAPAPLPSPIDRSKLPAEDEQARDQAIDAFVDGALPDLKEASLEDARRMGPVLKEEASSIDDPNVEGAHIQLRRLVFDGLEVCGWVDGRGRLNLTHVAVTHPRWRVRDGLGVGASVAEVQRVLGAPDAVRADALEYAGEVQAATFTLRDGRVARLELTYYWD